MTTILDKVHEIENTFETPYQQTMFTRRVYFCMMMKLRDRVSLDEFSTMLDESIKSALTQAQAEMEKL